MNAVIEQLNTNLKTLYRQALDADTQLEALQAKGHGKFSALLPKDAGFTFEAKRFKPYVLDIAADVEALSKQQNLDPELLQSAVVKIQNIHKLLAQFKNSK